MTTTSIVEIENTFTAWANAVTGRMFYVKNLLGPQPSGSYGTVNVIGVDAQDNDVVDYDTNFTTETIRGLSEVRILFDFWGGRPVQTLTALKNAISSASRYRDIWTICGRGNVGEVIDLSVLFLGKIEPRAELRISVWAALTTTIANPDYFDSTYLIVNEHDFGEVSRSRIGTNMPPQSQSTEGC
jgi:hypothetical protein